MKKSLIFATGNPRKIREAQTQLRRFTIDIIPQSVDINEIQHHDPIKIAEAKAIAAYNHIRQPLVINDTSWSIPALQGFPGGYMKDVAEWFQGEDWIQLLNPYQDKTIICHETVVYYDGHTLKTFTANSSGYFVDAIKSRGGNSLEQVIVLHGDKTIAEQHEKSDWHEIQPDLEHWTLFGSWFSSID